MNWIQKMHSPDPSVSHSRVWASIVMIFIIASLGIDGFRHGLSDQWVDLAKWLLGAVTVGYVGGKATAPRPEQNTPVEGGE